MYLERFLLPGAEEEERILRLVAEYNGGPKEKQQYIDNPYPCGIFPAKGLTELRFGKITVLYGGNGSGKSTLLNLIAQKLKLNRIAPFNSGETFASFTDACAFETGFDEEGFPHRIPDGSRIITSDDVFDCMLTLRTNNDEAAEHREEARKDWGTLKYGETVHMKSLDDYEALRQQVLARSRSVTRREFIRRTAGQETRLRSNGETALAYFQTRLRDKTLYLLDEPENSLSPKLQLELAAALENAARFFGDQLVIATHSPFLLALSGARVYDLDAVPVKTRPWWELENVRTYYDFFKKHEARFEENGGQ